MKFYTVHKKIIIGLSLGAVLVAVSVFGSAQKPKTNTMLAGALGAAVSQIEIATVGSSTGEIMPTAENSWPGEIVSLNNLPVQPGREGTISGWFVRIGQYVREGQTLGTLSRPPQTPDVVNMLSEKQEDLSRTRASVSAEREFTEKRIAQLRQLRADTEQLALYKTDLLGANGGTLSAVASKKETAQSVLRGSIMKTFPMMFTQASIPASGAFSSVSLKTTIGALNSNLRNGFPEIITRAWSELGNENIVPEQSGLRYFDSALKLVNASIADGDMLTGKDLDSLKSMLITDQSMFTSALGEIKNMEIESVNIKKESVDKLSEIDKELAELQKMLAVSEGEIIAKESAYGTIAASINGGYSITAPKSGTVSAIMKKPGDFVSPGMPVATVTSGKNEQFVRMRLPNNVRKPKIGEIFSVIRPGFANDARKARLVGIGSSLDENGSYMADAIFTEAIDWPAGASVRVIIPSNSLAITIKSSAVVFGEGGKPYVWGVTEAGRVFKKPITIGRIMGENTEAYEGLKNGDRYVVLPTSDIREDMLVNEVKGEEQGESDYDKAMRAMGM
ncbi:MAG: HlyD family efflux transporter periplasmic adaptor subunit [Parcubacteria group bacterium]|nr:HlyD family efflux transporter periplasmic adaptor subunit [Parcubacteria group bacterium]